MVGVICGTEAPHAESCLRKVAHGQGSFGIACEKRGWWAKAERKNGKFDTIGT